MNLGKQLAVSAIAGILAAGCGGGQGTVKGPTTDTAAGSAANKCGNHDGGACGALDPAPSLASVAGVDRKAR